MDNPSEIVPAHFRFGGRVYEKGERDEKIHDSPCSPLSLRRQITVPGMTQNCLSDQKTPSNRLGVSPISPDCESVIAANVDRTSAQRLQSTLEAAGIYAAGHQINTQRVRTYPLEPERLQVRLSDCA